MMPILSILHEQFPELEIKNIKYLGKRHILDEDIACFEVNDDWTATVLRDTIQIAPIEPEYAARVHVCQYLEDQMRGHREKVPEGVNKDLSLY